MLVHNYKNEAKTFIGNEINKDLKKTEERIESVKNVEKENNEILLPASNQLKRLDTLKNTLPQNFQEE